MKKTGSNTIVQRLITHNNSRHTSSLTKTTRQYFCPRNCVFNFALSNKPNLIVPNNKLFYPTTTTFGQIRSYTTTNWWKEKEASTNDSDGTNTSAPSFSEPITLNLMDYKKWNAQQVASVLTSDESLGGAGLSVEKVKPLYEAGFDGSSLHNIVENIKKKDEYFALKAMSGSKDFTQVSENTCQTVVFWVLDQLMTRQYSLWQLEPVSKQVIQKLGEPIAKGGADLSLDQVSSLDVKTLSKVIAAVEKERVKGATEEKCMQYAIKIMKSDKDFASVSESTCKAFAEWVAKLGFIRISSDMLNSWKHLEGEISEQLRMERANPKYDYLRNLQDKTKMEKLETLIGSNIELPIFEQADLVPKGFDPKAKYLFTRQRFDILKRVVSGENGFVFSGPHGVSKSYTLYLIAAYAFVNSIQVLYVPKCAIWKNCYFSQQKHGANKYLLQSFLSLNSDILSPSVLSDLEKSNDIIRYLSRTVASNKPVFYLFDEHNELFRPDTYGNIIATEPYFQDFTKWTGSTAGTKTMTIYCGSAHSTFENNLPGGEELRIVRIVPPTATEFETLVSDFGLDPSDKRIEFVTGRIPRSLKNLAYFLKDKDGTDDDFNNFINSSWNDYSRRLNILYKKLDLLGKKSFLGTLEGLFTLAINNGRPSKIEGIAYDQGLLYKDSSEKLFIVNEPAKRCLFEFYCFHFQISGIPASIPASEKGALFQRYLLIQEFNIGKHVGKFYTTNNKNIPIQQTISYEINTQQSLNLKDMRVLDANNYPTGTGVLFVPESEHFPSFDYAIITYCGEKVEILLKQTTISTVDSHYCHNTSREKTDLSNLLTPQYYIENGQAILPKSLEVPKPYLFSLLELIFRGVINERKVNSEEVKVEKKGKDGKKKLVTLNLEPNKLQLHFIDKENTLVKSITYNDIQFTWYYIYESGTDSSHQSVKKVKENGILYRNRQEIAERMKVFFK